jgi:crotonobetainyl-CoA:carnitine CoA-transferase CaiB-like acyl-CoA transferase
MTGPLSGVRVVDLTAMLSGPYATMILADQGAEVIKVEPPEGGDHTRKAGNRRNGFAANFLNINRNKRSVAIDLKRDAGRALVLRLCQTADVFVQNFRPGVVERLGLSEAAVRQARPDIVYVSISGFGERGPWAQKPAYDPVIQALSGITSVQAGSDEGRRRLVRTVVSDKVTAITASEAITAALFHRAKTGEGQHVRLSMLDAVVAFLWASDMGAQTYVDEPLAQQAAASFIDLIYATADGYMTVAVMSDKEWAGLCRALEHPEWLADPRFATPALRDRHVNERLAMTQEVLQTRTTAAWIARLEAADVPCAPALTRNEMMRHPQVLASELILETEHPQVGRLRQTRPAARFDKTPAGIRAGAPMLGAQTEAVLTELGLSGEEIAALRREGVVGVAE